VIERLRAIETASPRSDGVAVFARLYRQVTEGVNADLTRSTFADSRFLERLDIRFAGLFLSALDADATAPASTPSAWIPLFSRRSARGIAPLQFALAGMNAHINPDLPVALLATCEELGLDLRGPRPNGQALWALRDEPALASAFLLALDRMVGLASRGLLVPVDSPLRKLGRLLQRGAVLRRPSGRRRARARVPARPLRAGSGRRARAGSTGCGS
jgi:hypothetical protein